jgi:hypothetical protein
LLICFCVCELSHPLEVLTIIAKSILYNVYGENGHINSSFSTHKIICVISFRIHLIFCTQNFFVCLSVFLFVCFTLFACPFVSLIICFNLYICSYLCVYLITYLFLCFLCLCFLPFLFVFSPFSVCMCFIALILRLASLFV